MNSSHDVMFKGLQLLPLVEIISPPKCKVALRHGPLVNEQESKDTLTLSVIHSGFQLSLRV